MRLDVSTVGLFAWLLGGVDAAAENEMLGTRTTTGPNPVVSFAVLPTPNVFLNSEDKPINWTVLDASMVVVEAKLCRMNNQTLATASVTSNAATPSEASSTSPSTTTATTTATDDSARPTFPGRGSGPSVGRSGLLDFIPDSMGHMASELDKRLDLPFDNSDHGSVTLKINSSATAYETAGAFDTPLFLQLHWSLKANPDVNGSINSPVFALTNNEGNIQTLGEEIERIAPGNTAETGNLTPSASPTTGTTPAAPGTATPPSNATPDSTSDGELSMGAKIGIGIGCGIAGLLVIAAIMYFAFFRRRRNQKHMSMHTGYASDSVGRGIMIDKEMPAVNESSPHSAYAEDGGHLHDPSRRSMVAGVHDGDHQDNAAYAPYTDRSPSPPGTAGAATVGTISSRTDLHQTGTRSPTPPITARYAHLVEEGMTEDEIRRLEEEERQLDAAIESAGRRSSRRDL